jgi:trk system potassium uptake protein TrkH
MVMVLMIIGGGTGSTAGGIKVTTVLVLVLAAIAYFRKTRHIRVFRTSVDTQQVHKALALGMVTFIVFVTATFILLATQGIDMIDLMFESTSALGTVGLSRGITGELDQTGRTTLMVLMFLGRLGPLTLGYFIASQRPPLTQYPKGQIHLG